MTWKLKRTTQCDKCPWRVGVNPRDIPNGYCERKHAALIETIAAPGDIRGAAKAFACHETDDAHCIGWLMHQLGPGNNIGLRLQMITCENSGKIRLKGEQHQTFEDTLPASLQIGASTNG